MNEIVSKFIEEQKEKQKVELQKQKVELQKQREEHLVELGLIDEELSEKRYAHPGLSEYVAKEYGYTHQDSKGFYKIKNGVAMKVSDEEYEEICKLCPPKKGKSNSNNPGKSNSNNPIGSDFAEKAASCCAWVIFIAGIGAAITLLIDTLYGLYYENEMFEIAAGVLIYSAFIFWSIMLVLVNISHKLDR